MKTFDRYLEKEMEDPEFRYRFKIGYLLLKIKHFVKKIINK